MMVRYWQPIGEMNSLRRQLDSLFNELALAETKEINWIPAVELEDAGDKLVLKAQLPGIDPKDIDVQVTASAVLLAGEHRQKQETSSQGIFKSEFRYGSFRRVIPLPVAVENDKVQAEYKDGILTLNVPKKEASVRNQVVKINLAQLDRPSPTPTEQVVSEANDESSNYAWGNQA